MGRGRDGNGDEARERYVGVAMHFDNRTGGPGDRVGIFGKCSDAIQCDAESGKSLNIWQHVASTRAQNAPLQLAAKMKMIYVAFAVAVCPTVQLPHSRSFCRQTVGQLDR